MNRSRSKPAKKTRHSADIITTEELAAMRDVRLCQRGLAGDVDAMIQWLAAFGVSVSVQHHVSLLSEADGVTWT